MVNYSVDMLDETFAALASPIRRGMLERLSRGWATVGELAEPYDVSPPAISKHLRVLEKAGLVERRVRGRVHYCRLVPQRHGGRRGIPQFLQAVLAGPVPIPGRFPGPET